MYLNDVFVDIVNLKVIVQLYISSYIINFKLSSMLKVFVQTIIH